MDLVMLKDEKTGTEAAILPEVGVLLHSFTVHTQTGVFNIIENYNGLDQAKKEVGRSFKSVRLSPFPCRVSGECRWEWNPWAPADRGRSWR